MAQRVVRTDLPGEVLPTDPRDAVDLTMTNMTESLSLNDTAAAAGVGKRLLYIECHRHLSWPCWLLSFSAALNRPCSESSTPMWMSWPYRSPP